MNDVFKLGLALRHLHPNNERLAIRLLLLNLFLGVAEEAEAIILSLGVFLPADLDPHLLEALSCAEARVRISVLQQCVYELVVKRETMALEVWSVGSLSLETFVLALISLLCQAAGPFVPDEA